MNKMVSFQLLVELIFEKKTVREENAIEKNENESEDDEVEHSKGTLTRFSSIQINQIVYWLPCLTYI